MYIIKKDIGIILYYNLFNTSDNYTDYNLMNTFGVETLKGLGDFSLAFALIISLFVPIYIHFLVVIFVNTSGVETLKGLGNFLFRSLLFNFLSLKTSRSFIPLINQIDRKSVV